MLNVGIPFEKTLKVFTLEILLNLNCEFWIVVEGEKLFLCNSAASSMETTPWQFGCQQKGLKPDDVMEPLVGAWLGQRIMGPKLSSQELFLVEPKVL
ncbi:hypothetical protein GOP47_0022974 [Adiantum capillus-veneris]|uniref:Uncharacterized protein n=1 Tax=Adiantum capillus-veneris TaxID=13818 RepID=A0A9D4U6V2_ADICA|nr:hypothetical protein GOP47_0022974 [Adiantum capillus-veneris]